jgi:hypothetical protein
VSTHLFGILDLFASLSHRNLANSFFDWNFIYR